MLKSDCGRIPFLGVLLQLAKIGQGSRKVFWWRGRFSDSSLRRRRLFFSWMSLPKCCFLGRLLHKKNKYNATWRDTVQIRIWKELLYFSNAISSFLTWKTIARSRLLGLQHPLFQGGAREQQKHVFCNKKK